jgi:ATP adenylyltransferase
MVVERLWAPWRLAYVTGEKAGACFLCEAARTDDPARAGLVCRDDRTVVVLNRFPYNNGHLLVAPVAHVPGLGDLDDTTLLALVRAVERMRRLLDGVLKPDGYNVGVNLGKVAGAGLAEHLHLHVVPRWAGDTNFMPVLADTKILPQALEDLRERLVAACDQGRA